MARSKTSASVLAVKVESTIGTPVFPASASDFVALQPDIELTPNFNELSNEELRGSIGPAKTIQGLEQPEASFSHYLRHSGVEGQAPNFGEIIEGAFGSSSANATERVTAAASTVSLVKLTAGGSDFARGKAILVKDGTNGYSIRPVHSVSTNDLTLGFQLANAPASGISVGKCVNYAPANSGHQSLSLHLYRANEHSYELLAGSKVTEFSFEAKAGEFVNGSFSFKGTKYFFDPINILSTDRYLDFDDGSGPYAAVVTAKAYRDPHELASALQASMNAQGSSDTFTVVYNDRGANAGKFTISTDGAQLDLLWNTGTNTANTIGDKIGFSVAADDTGSLTYTSDNAQVWSAPYTPSYDVADPLAAKNNEILIGDSDDILNFCAQTISFKLTNESSDATCITAESGLDETTFTKRTAVVSVEGYLERHDAELFDKFVNNSDTRMLVNLGTKSGGNWIPGRNVSLYLPSATISNFKSTDLDNFVGVSFDVKAFVDSSGNGEVYLNFL